MEGNCPLREQEIDAAYKLCDCPSESNCHERCFRAGYNAALARASQPEKGENSIKDGIALQLLDIADCKECSDREKIASVRTYARYGLLSSPAPLAMKDKCLSCQWFKESGEPLACLTCENNSNFKVQQKEASDGR